MKTTATTTTSGGASFNLNTLDLVNRIMIMRINEDLEIEVLLDASISEAIKYNSSSIGLPEASFFCVYEAT